MNPLLEIRNLSKTFRYRTGLFHRQTVEAVKPISFILRKGQTLSIIGENGSGKSTLAKMVAGLIEPTGGEILINEQFLCYGNHNQRSQCIRMVFQNPDTSLNPHQCIGRMLDMPLKFHSTLTTHEREQRINDTLKQVGLSTKHSGDYPYMLSDGQKQRVAFARALILHPQLIVIDEALGSLDISIRSQLINLMLEVQESLAISYLYVTQHLGFMKHISDQVFVMQNGEVVERGNAAEVLISPLHDLTKRLIASHFDGALPVDIWRNDI